MTVFSVLKYPVSNPATREQLEALPAPLFKRITDQLMFGAAQLTPYQLAFNLGVYLSYPDDEHITKNGLNMQRIIEKTIFEYDE